MKRIYKNSSEKRAASIYTRFFRLLLAALAASLLFFFLLNQSGNFILQAYFDKTDYMSRENNRRVQLFRDYVEEHQLSSDDSDELNRWVRHQSVVSTRWKNS